MLEPEGKAESEIGVDVERWETFCLSASIFLVIYRYKHKLRECEWRLMTFDCLCVKKSGNHIAMDMGFLLHFKN